MFATVPSSEQLFDVSVRQGQVRHALKVGLACTLSTAVVFSFHAGSQQLAPLFSFLLLTLAMPSPRMNWLLTQLAVGISAIVVALILIYFHATLFLYLPLTLLWIFVCLLFSGWLPLPATLAGMIAAISVFTYLDGDVGITLDFLRDYQLNLLVGGLSVVVVHTCIWPLNTPKVFVRRLAQVYAKLEQDCRAGSVWLRTGQTPPVAAFDEWAPFRPLRQLLAPELFRRRETTSPFAGLILACRALNLRLWFFNHAFSKLPVGALTTATRHSLADLMDAIASHLATLVAAALDHRQAARFDPPSQLEPTPVDVDSRQADPLVANNVHAALLKLLVQDLQTATKYHNLMFAHFGRGFGGELVNLWPGPNSAALFDVQSVRAAVKLVLILVLLMLEEGWLGLPGGSQVAFFATFFASTANLGRQNKTDLVDVVGLLSGFAYGVAAAFITSRLPHFPLLLALLFLGQFLADLAFQRLPLYSVAGLQAGLAIPFTYLATVGPEWGSFTTVRTRLAGLLVAGFTAVIVHACVWPVYPMRALRNSIATAVRSVAVSIAELFAGPRDRWQGSPLALRDTIVRARDLLDDARYLPGPEHADATYHGVIIAFQQIDASLEFIHLLIGLNPGHPFLEQFFATVAEYPASARTNLETVARQFDDPPTRDGPIAWQPDTAGRWNQALATSTLPSDGFIAQRPAVIARCLDEIAAAADEISTIGCTINGRRGDR